MPRPALHGRPVQTGVKMARAATDAIGAYHFNGSRYETALPSRDCHGRKAPSQ